MKICFLAPADNYHTRKWCEYFENKGHQVDVISFTDGNIENVKVHYLDCKVKATDSDIKKIRYLLKKRQVKKLIKNINPDIINAHYATSYGMVAALCGVKYVLSVWGSDVYDFPKKSFLHKIYFKYLIKKSTYILSTSKSMKNEISKYTKKQIYITPFGVKMDLFRPIEKKHKGFIIGTVKALKEKYGIQYIVEAASIIKKERPDIDLKIRIAGRGDKEQEYKELAEKLKVKVDWLGYISQEQAAYEWANMDIAIIPTINNESFGVSAVEAEACETALIVSNVSGLLETTTSKSRIVIPQKNAEKLANAIIYLYDNPEKRIRMGIEGRKYVVDRYEYEKCFDDIEGLFFKIIKR